MSHGTVLVEGPVIMIRPVGARRVVADDVPGWAPFVGKLRRGGLTASRPARRTADTLEA